MLEIGRKAELQIPFLGHRPGQDKKEEHVKGVDELVVLGRCRVLQQHQPLDEVAVKDQGHGIEPGNVDEPDSSPCRSLISVAQEHSLMVWSTSMATTM